MKQKILIGFSVVIALTLSCTANASLIENGSFNGYTGNTNLHNSNTTGELLPHWKITDGSPDIFNANTDFYGYEWGASSDGGDFLHSLYTVNYLGEWLETIEQTVSGLTVGQEYALSFEQSISRGDRTEAGGFWQIAFGEETQNSSAMGLPGYSEGFTGWQRQTLLFTATAEEQILSITAYNSSGDSKRTDIGLDGLSLDATGISPVPEPATMYLLGVGLVALAGIRFRKTYNR